jgi:biopolymer transport protein ExbD
MGAQLSVGGGKRQAIVGINVTPMVDVVLVLLIIMMVSATYIVSQSLKVELPKSASSDDSVPMVAAVAVDKDGKLFFNQKPVSENELVEKMRDAHAQNPDVNLVISGDAHAFHGSIVHVIDLAKQEGIAKFAINVERE